MIQRIGVSGMSFKGNELTSARSAYSSQLEKNEYVANGQSIGTNASQLSYNAQIPMQGQQIQQNKLDFIV